MSELDWIGLLLVVGGLGVFVMGSRWYRRRRTARAADQLLEEIVRGKDAFRR